MAERVCSPASLPEPVMMLMTPSGIPASWRLREHQGGERVSSAGFQHDRVAGGDRRRIFQAAIWSG